MTDQTPQPIEPTAVVESGVAFPGETDASVSVAAQFLESGNQLQQVFVGLEPVLLVQPEFDADENEVTFVVTAVDLDAPALVDVLDVLLDAAKEMVRIQEQQQEEIAESAAADES